jgi:peptidoglycan biosynthesis protein MviN/MurJ (putative lipid II flippase)
MMAGDRPDEAFRISALSIATNAGVTVLLVPIYGITGAAIGMFLAYLLNAVLYYHRVPRLLDVQIDLPGKHIAWILGAAVLMTGAVWALKSVLQPRSLLTLGTVVGVGGLLYAGLLLANSELRRSFAHVLDPAR